MTDDVKTKAVDALRRFFYELPSVEGEERLNHISDYIAQLEGERAGLVTEGDRFRQLYHQAAECVQKSHPEAKPFDQFVRRVFEEGFNAALSYEDEDMADFCERAFREWLQSEAHRS